MRIEATTEERAILSRLCDDLAAKAGPLYKNSHTILRAALDAPENNELRDALADVFELIQSGQLARDISHDAEPGFAMRQMPFVQRLIKAKTALDNATPPEGNS